MSLPAVNGVVEHTCGALASAGKHLDQAIRHLQQAIDDLRDAGAEHAQYALLPLYRKFQYGLPTGAALDEVKELVAKNMATAAWLHLVDHIKMDFLMNEQQYQDFKNELYTDPPAFTPDVVADRFFFLAENRRQIAIDGLIQTFNALHVRFKSHNQISFGSRVILSDVASQDYRGVIRINTHADGIRRLRDLQRGVDALLYPERRHDPARDIVSLLVAHVNQHQREPMDAEYLRVTVCKNGNAHVWFSDVQVTDRLNDVLAGHYGDALGHQ